MAIKPLAGVFVDSTQFIDLLYWKKSLEIDFVAFRATHL